MSMNNTPMSERVHIGFFGKRNAGKSSVMNAVTGQDLAVVSDVKGTTTDPVYKSMELLPLGPVVVMDTPGIDDEGELGSLRVKKSYQVLNKTDTAVLVIDGTAGASEEDRALLERIRKKNIPFVVVINKKELADKAVEEAVRRFLSLDRDQLAFVSAATGDGIYELKEQIAAIAATEEPEKYLVRDLLDPSDIAVLVVPIDSAAPKGRLILASAADDPRYPRSGCGLCSGKRDGTKRRAGKAWNEAEDRNYGQPGVWSGIRRYAGRYPADFFLYIDGKI